MSYIYVEDEPQTGEKPKVRLIGVDGNAFNIMAQVKKAMKGFQKENPEYYAEGMFQEYQDDATRGDYDHLLQVTMAWCDVY